jgi:hypothetical protein
MRLPRSEILIASLLGLMSLTVYWLTLTPSLSQQSPDGTELATVPCILGLAHSPGYPLYTWLGKLFCMLPMGDAAHRINFMSAVMGALAVACLYLIGIRLLDSRMGSKVGRHAAAALAALLLAFSPTMWSQAVIAEVYTPNLAFIALTILALLRWERTKRDRDFGLFALIFGLSLGMHISNLGFAPGIAIYVLLVDRTVLKRPKWWLAGLGGFAIGVAQFAWLPLRASTLNDQMMLARSPTTLLGIYNYTLGAFSQIRFAFPLTAIPDRVVVYLDLLIQQFGLLGFLLGVVGLFSLLFRRTRHYLLLTVVYLVQLWFFIQYRAFDLEVFFLPAHFIWAIFIAAGSAEALGGLEGLARMLLADRGRRIVQWGLAVTAVLLVLIPLTQNWTASDRSDDVGVNDFYANVWELLPEDAVLLTAGGVFGYEAFYWQLIYDTRSDVFLPAKDLSTTASCDLTTQEVFATASGLAGRGGTRFRTAHGCELPERYWSIPVLAGIQEHGTFGGRTPMILFRLSATPPELSPRGRLPDIRLNAPIGGVTLVGADLEPDVVESGGRVHLRLYWRLDHGSGEAITVSLGGEGFAEYQIGFGNLPQNQAQIQNLVGRVMVEDYWLVIPSTTQPGEISLDVGLRGSNESITVAQLLVVDEEETMERWLRIAGKSSLVP